MQYQKVPESVLNPTPFSTPASIPLLMKIESQYHKAIRLSLLARLRESGLDPMSSHDADHPEIHFYHGSKPEERIHLADPDILVQDDNRFLAIEIELSLSPKHLLGVAFAVSRCTHYKVGDGEMLPLGKFDFLLVVPSTEVKKKGSHRPKQLQFVEDALQGLADFKSAHIVADDMVWECLKKWQDG